MQSSEDRIAANHGLLESNKHVLNLLDSLDTYLTLLDSLSSALRQGWLELASARHSMGNYRINSTLFDLKPHSASTKFRVDDDGPDQESPRFVLCKWTSANNDEKFDEEAKFEEDNLMKKKSNSPDVPDKELLEGKGEVAKSPVTPDNHAQKERFQSLSMFRMLVSPKLRATQQSFETALETLVEIANVRASLLLAHDQVKND